jgi:type III secretion system YscQ/HrcQ family protein
MYCIKLKAGKSFFWLTINQWPKSIVRSRRDVFSLVNSTSKGIRHLAVEIMLTPFIRWLERATQVNITVVDYVKKKPDFRSRLAFSFFYEESDKQWCAGQIAISEGLRESFFSLLERWPAVEQKRVDFLRLNTQLMIGSTVITVEELNTVEVGDVVFLDQNIYSEGGLMWAHFSPDILIILRKGPQTMADVDPSGHNVTVEAVTEGEMPDQSQPSGSDNQQGAKNLAVEHLEIKLDFDLGGISLSLAQIKQLTPGYIFSIGRPLERAVNISSNGQRLASGELVDIDGIVGVRVKKLFKKNNG